MTDTISLSDWDRLVDRLHEWARDRPVTADRDHARVEFRNAQFTVHRDGRVDAGMPLHDADLTATELRFEEDAVHVRGEGVAYTFRRP